MVRTFSVSLTSTGFMRGPLVVTSIESGCRIVLKDGPPWDGDKHIRHQVLRGDGKPVTVRLTAAQAICLPHGSPRCVVTGHYLDDEPQFEDEDNELRWGQHRRAFGARLDA
jgi:hypothetical protein